MNHTVVGPKGGLSIEDVSCYTCICGNTCRILTTTKAFGCGDWVNERGQRVYWGPVEAKDLPADPPGKTCDGCGACQDIVEPPPLPLDSSADMIKKLTGIDVDAPLLPAHEGPHA